MMDEFNKQCEAILDEAKAAFVLTTLGWDGPHDSPVIDAADAQLHAVQNAVAALREAHEEHLREMTGLDGRDVASASDTVSPIAEVADAASAGTR